MRNKSACLGNTEFVSELNNLKCDVDIVLGSFMLTVIFWGIWILWKGVENVLAHIHICMKERTLHIKQLDFKISFKNSFNGWDGLYDVYN